VEHPIGPVDLAAVPGAGGVVWSGAPSGVHVNLVVLEPGGSIGDHRNDEIDVLFVVLDGSSTVQVDDATWTLRAAETLLVPKGASRSVEAGSNGVRYLTVHAERAPLGIKGRQ
jgi:quercetin dioxygenase-like cupin family protein